MAKSAARSLIRTVGELRDFLKSTGQSPEQLAGQLSISNMTIRRLLKRRPDQEIPAKYRLQFQQLSMRQTGDFEQLLDGLEESGAKVEDLAALDKQLDTKLQDKNIGAALIEKARILREAAFSRSDLRSKALALGALLYLLNPIDLIPDTLGPIGYLDDFAVVTMVCDQIVRARKKQAADAAKAPLA